MAENRNTQQRPPMGPPGRGPRGARPIEKPKNLKNTIKKVSKYIGYHKSLFITLIVLILLVTGCGLLAPVIQSEIINKLTIINLREFITADGKPLIPSEVYDTAFQLLGVLALVYGCNSILVYFQQRTAAKLSQVTVMKMRNDLFGRFVKLPIKFLDTHSHGDLMSRMTNDVENVSNTISQSIASLFSGILSIIGNLVIMIYYSWLLTIVSMVTVVLTLLVTKFMTKRMRNYYVKQSALLGKLNGHLEEMVTGYRTVAAYGKEPKVKAEFDDISNELTHVSINGQILSGSMGPIMNFISNFGYVLIAAFGAWIAISKPWGISIEIGTIALFLTCSRNFSRPINEIANLFGQILTAMAGAERVFEILDAEEEVDEGKIQLDADKFVGNISFKNVDFSYVPNQKVLKNFNLDVKPGQKIALVGATGSGKTTVVNLLMRFYDVDSGSIEIDGVNINDIPKDDLRSTIAIVLQDTVLFKDTIAANIKYGKLDAEFDQMKAAAILSNANYFVKKLPDKYETMLSEGGNNLSQGQRQLLSIARAVLADPKILILDEATSSVDTMTEKNIQDAMANLMHNRTSLIIAHRLSTIQDADVIVVMDNGYIVETGNHHQLLEQKGRYYNLYQTQFAGNKT